MSRSSPNLLSLPTEVLRLILFYADVRSLANLSETSQEFHALATSDALWHDLTRRRFRLSRRSGPPRRAQIAGSICWRTLYSNWHTQVRMPISRHSGPTFRAFARAATSHAAVWFTVSSAEDCRLQNSVLRARVVVQNIGAGGHQGVVTLVGKKIAVNIGGVGLLRQVDDVKGGCQVHVRGAVVQALSTNRWIQELDTQWRLGMDDFVVVPIDVRMCGADAEIDALERVTEVHVPILVDGTESTVVARMSDKQIWDAYELLPGGWWARVG